MQTLLPMVERSRNNPYEISLTVALGCLGLMGVVVLSPASASLDAGLPLLLRLLYSIICLIGAVLTMAGLKWRDEHRGLGIECAGQWFVAGGALVFVAVLCKVSSFAESGLVTGVGAAICVAAFWRCWQIRQDLRSWNEKIKAQQIVVDSAIDVAKEALKRIDDDR